ncbi:polygalacturonase ADPG1-like [Phoenix dactylifera]|uniref:Polygalacturonase ADPG1-like n=1 Tax=Phoenix dactylifera TaxID=42345 RepID=A0A8B9AB85_PHODC|nr:polygalacturonase ADPG1-like [Phoenix dactylifera]
MATSKDDYQPLPSTISSSRLGAKKNQQLISNHYQRGSVCTFTFLLFASLAVGVLSGPIYNVIHKGAKGDGKTDDAQALTDTWNAACSDSKVPTLLIPSGYTFLADQLYFQGPCKSYIRVQVDGTILSPYKIRAVRENHWISFVGIEGITINGTGYIDGQGAVWYDGRAKQKCKSGPTAFVVGNCSHVNLKGLNFKNSPMMHLTIQRSFVVSVSGITITAPEDSPNTDGIHIQRSRHIQISHSVIGTGDDCISIETNTKDVNISHVRCGPGHGISIGSLGEDDSEAKVEGIRVSHCQFNGTTNGVRIKTCQTSAVQVSDVRYVDLVGSSATDEAILIKCSQSHPCTDIVLDNVRLKSADPRRNITNFCFNAFGTKKHPIVPALSCLTPN